MASCSYSDGRESMNHSLLIGFVESFGIKQFGAKFGQSSLSVERFLGRVVGSKIALSRKLIEVPEAKIGGRRTGSCTLIGSIKKVTNVLDQLSS